MEANLISSLVGKVETNIKADAANIKNEATNIKNAAVSQVTAHAPALVSTLQMVKNPLTALQTCKSLMSSHSDSMSCGRFLSMMSLLVTSTILMIFAVHLTQITGKDLHEWLDHMAPILGVMVSFTSAPYALVKAAETFKKGDTTPPPSHDHEDDKG